MPFAWPKNKLQATKITKQQVLALVNGFAEANMADDNEDPSDFRNDVESYTFTNLDNGPLYLVATDDGGSTWFQYFELIRCKQHRCHQITIHSDPSIDLDKQLLDLKMDGRHQILAEVCVCVEASRQGAYLPYIYEISNNKVIDSSKKYPEYYRPWLAPIKHRVPDNLNSQDMIDKGYAESLFEQHDVERRIFGKAIAGLSDALQWEKSKDTAIIQLAIETYVRIDSPEADAGLKRLAQSDIPYIRDSARQTQTWKALKHPH
jgi:hypothetical protein